MEYTGFMKKVFQKLDKLDFERIKDIMEELNTEKELYRLVFDSMIEGVIVTNRDNKIILMNKRMEDIIGTPADRALNIDITECNLTPELKDVIVNALINNERVLEKEVNISRNDKTFTITILPLVHTGDTEGNIIILMDITEKKMREFQLRQAESLAALTTLSAGVAHEIKNPLASIDIHIQLINREISKFKEEDVKNIKNLLAIVKEEIDRLNSIVQDFLFAVRPMNFNLSNENINDIIKDMIDFLKYELMDADIEVIYELDDNLPPVLVDPKYLKQALLNVIKNSIEAIHGGGKIIIKTEETVDGDVVIHIIDNGEGIPPELMKKIFEPYFTTRKSGTGLGLVIVYKIIKELGGDIRVKSEPGKGTIFSIKLPVFEKKKKLLTYEGKNEG